MPKQTLSSAFTLTVGMNHMFSDIYNIAKDLFGHFEFDART